MLSAALISFLFTDKKCRLWQPHFTVVLRCSFFQPKDLQCILAVVRLWLFSCDINFLVEMVMFARLMSAISELSQYVCVRVTGEACSGEVQATARGSEHWDGKWTEAGVVSAPGGWSQAKTSGAAVAGSVSETWWAWENSRRSRRQSC